MRHPRWILSAVLGSALSLMPVAVAHATTSQPFITAYAGTGTGAAPIAGPATSSPLSAPDGVGLDAAGDLYIADWGNQLIESVTPSGTLSVLDGASPALVVAPQIPVGPNAVAVDASGNAYVADAGRHVVYEFSPLGVRSVFAGTGASSAPVPGAAASSPLMRPTGVAVDAAGNVYIADAGAQEVLEVSNGVLSVFAGTGWAGAPAPGTATSSDLSGPSGVAVDPSGNVYIADTSNNLIEKVTAGGTLSLVAGTGSAGAPTPGAAPLSSALSGPQGVAVDGSGDVYVADTGNYDVEEISGGQVSVIAGTGSQGTPTLGLFAAGQPLGGPTGVAVDSAGTVFVTDQPNNIVDRIGLATPGAPTALSAAAAGSSSASLSFNAPVDTGLFALTGYEVSVDGGQTWQSLTTSGSAALTATVTGLSPGATYTVEVRADNGAGASPASAGANVSLPSVSMTSTGSGSSTGTSAATTSTATSSTTSTTTAAIAPKPTPKPTPKPKPKPRPKPRPTAPAAPSSALSLAIGRSVNGGVSASIDVPGPGTLYVLATEAHEGLTRAASKTRIVPGPGRFTYAAATVVATQSGPMAVHLQRTVAGWAMLVRHRAHGWALHVNVSVVYVPTQGGELYAAQKVEILPAGRPLSLPSAALGSAASSVLGG